MTLLPAPFALLALPFIACAGPRPAEIPRTDAALVVIKTVRLPTNEPWYTRFAEHSWIDMHTEGSATWTRVEANLDPEVWEIPTAEAFLPTRWGREVELLAVVEGDAAAASIPLIREEAARVAEGFVYRAFPGPNSNTYTTRILRGVPGLTAELEHNSVGKDYTPTLSFGATATGDGLHLDTIAVGLSLGYLSGVELHVFGLTAGLGFWPPALKLPILPRIGLAPGTSRMP
jgi:hypothetical protein